jgi:hypothetical protein
MSYAPARKECSCPVEHTITKLGHCDSCPYGDPHERIFVRPPNTSKEHVHDFEWATYSDDWMSTGVCSCGMTAISHDIERDEVELRRLGPDRYYTGDHGLD